MKNMMKMFIPPIAMEAYRTISSRYLGLLRKTKINSDAVLDQELEVYWDPNMALALETWGQKNTWHELYFLMSGLEGNVLDIACGTGRNIEDLSIFSKLKFYGCDISEFLLSKGIGRGIPPERFTVCDATLTGYKDNFFDYSYSIGSFEHFTERGLLDVIQESHRVTKKQSFHQVPVSRSGKDEGWVRSYQSYHNNSVDWWLSKYQSVYSNVIVLDSLWEDRISVGKWFLCEKN